MKVLSICASVLLGVVVLLGAVGCADAKEDPMPGPDITLEEAREFQNQVLVELMAYVPENRIVDDFGGPVARGSTMTCSGPEGYIFLPGAYSADLDPELDLDAVLERIYADYVEKSGWEVSWARPEQDREISMFSPEGYQFFLTPIPDADEVGNLRLMITSGSPCFVAPDDFDIFEDY